MPQVNRKKLDSLIEEAGIDEDTAQQIRDANDGKKPDSPKGHGTASPNLDTIEL